MKQYTTKQLEKELSKRKEEELNNRFSKTPTVDENYVERRMLDVGKFPNLWSVFLDDGCEGITFLIEIPNYGSEELAEKVVLNYWHNKNIELGIHVEDSKIYDIEVSFITNSYIKYIKVDHIDGNRKDVIPDNKITVDELVDQSLYVKDEFHLLFEFDYDGGKKTLHYNPLEDSYVCKYGKDSVNQQEWITNKNLDEIVGFYNKIK